MRLYLNVTKMTFEEDNIEHEIIRSVVDREIPCYDYMIELSDDDKFIEDTYRIIYKKDKVGKDTEEIFDKIFIIREQQMWNSFPLYELKSGKIIKFNWENYSYFSRTDRRMALADKISSIYNPPSEVKILRKTLKYIMDELKLNYPNYFSIMNKKIEEIIKKNPKDKSK